jgi:endonuclease/exonuclease/phosphatase family metal-dependent hydrolase
MYLSGTRHLTARRAPTITGLMRGLFHSLLTPVLCSVVAWARIQAAEAFTIATFNLENYLDTPTVNRPAKSDTAKAMVRTSLLAIKADVLAVQEMGGLTALDELRTSLRSAGLDYTYWELVSGPDTNIHVAILSRFPIAARRPHTNESFLLRGRRFRVGRGIADVDVRVNARYEFSLLAAHLKSRREVPEADQAELREQEAIILRRLIDQHLASDPNVNLVVLGDFNDRRNSTPIKLLLGHGTHALIDTRPIERNGDNPPGADPQSPSRTVAWTHYYAVEETYSRIDYILISRGMKREWDRTGTYVLFIPNWGIASDHRPLVARFLAGDQ